MAPLALLLEDWQHVFVKGDCSGGKQGPGEKTGGKSSDHGGSVYGLEAGVNRRIFTRLREILIHVNRNLTVNLPEELIHQIRIHAAHRNQSMTAVVRDALERVVSNEDEARTAASRLIEGMQNAPPSGLRGKIPWSREDLYGR